MSHMGYIAGVFGYSGVKKGLYEEVVALRTMREGEGGRVLGRGGGTRHDTFNPLVEPG